MTVFSTSAAIRFNSKFVAASPNILRSSIPEDSSSIKPIFSIDGVPLTEHNRKYSLSTSFYTITNSKWNNKKGIYFRNENIKKTFSFDWTYVPGKNENTVDLNAGRNFLNKIAYDNFDHILTIRNIDSNGLTIFTTNSYTVLVVDYTETLVRRDLDANEYYWDCSLKLEEV